MVELARRESDVYREKYKRTRTGSIGVSQSMGEKAEWARQQCEGEYVGCWITSVSTEVSREQDCACSPVLDGIARF
jgi:uncharacterized protein (DUF2132 family)